MFDSNQFEKAINGEKYIEAVEETQKVGPDDDKEELRDRLFGKERIFEKALRQAIVAKNSNWLSELYQQIPDWWTNAWGTVAPYNKDYRLRFIKTQIKAAFIIIKQENVPLDTEFPPALLHDLVSMFGTDQLQPLKGLKEVIKLPVLLVDSKKGYIASLFLEPVNITAASSPYPHPVKMSGIPIDKHFEKAVENAFYFLKGYLKEKMPVFRWWVEPLSSSKKIKGISGPSLYGAFVVGMYGSTRHLPKHLTTTCSGDISGHLIGIDGLAKKVQAAENLTIVVSDKQNYEEDNLIIEEHKKRLRKAKTAEELIEHFFPPSKPKIARIAGLGILLVSLIAYFICKHFEICEPPSSTITIPIPSSSTKQKWMEKAAANFNDEGKRTSSGAKIKIEVIPVLSGGSMNDILDGKLKPVAWSPGVESWVKQLNKKTNQPLMSQACQPTIYTPLGIAMWRPMAEALGWPNKPIGWKTIVALAKDGWASYGHPEWGSFRFGHAHPKYSNAGLLTMTSFVYEMTGKTHTLKPVDVFDAKEELRELAQKTSKYGMITTKLLDSMAEHDTPFLHAVATFESDTIRLNRSKFKGKLGKLWSLAFIFPAEGTFWGNHPYCILDKADWVNPEQAEAAAIFRDYLLKPSQQKLAVDSLLRPFDSNIPLHAPLDIANGTDPRVTPETVPALPFPNAEESKAVIDLFMKTKRKATVLVVLDTSHSMKGDKIRMVTNATAEFLERLHVNDVVGVVIFNNTVENLLKPQPAGDVAQELSKRVKNLTADGGTALYDAVCQATELMEDLQQDDLKRGDNRLYGIVLLSDGEDTSSQTTENEMFVTCLPEYPHEAENVKIFPIAFGDDADLDVLKRIAKVSGGELWEASPDTIEKIYLKISAEQ